MVPEFEKLLFSEIFAGVYFAYQNVEIFQETGNCKSLGLPCTELCGSCSNNILDDEAVDDEYEEVSTSCSDSESDFSGSDDNFTV